VLRKKNEALYRTSSTGAGRLKIGKRVITVEERNWKLESGTDASVSLDNAGTKKIQP